MRKDLLESRGLIRKRAPLHGRGSPARARARAVSWVILIAIIIGGSDGGGGMWDLSCPDERQNYYWSVNETRN